MKKVSNNKSDKNVRHRNHSSFIVLALGFILGAVLIGFGIYNNVNSNYNAFEIMTEEDADKLVEDKMNEAKKIRDQRDAEYEVSAYSEKYAELNRQLTIAEGELSDAEAELYNIKSGAYNGLKADKIWSSVPLIILGAVSIVVGIGLFFVINNPPKKKNRILTVTEEK